MIDKVVNIFKDEARQHKLIKSFFYNPVYEIGNGNEPHPVFWLESPIYLRNIGNIGQGIEIDLNFTIQILPSKETDEVKCETLAFSTGLNIIEHIKQNNLLEIKPNWTALTLRKYYDNSAVAVRFSLTVVHPNITNLCLLNEHFDTDKQFEVKELINDFDVNPASNCTTFVNKLPDFSIPTTR
ncbi:hypothetical protein [Dysgonomonas sp. 520]|uniref:hypothetical protein n=1 Tax=Dysgonomonas sp. 520 TaxID=2302931 RepID=UPI0013D452CB|nr:hypothetical protein [Dysgonomonas sp. 520]